MQATSQSVGMETVHIARHLRLSMFEAMFSTEMAGWTSSTTIFLIKFVRFYNHQPTLRSLENNTSPSTLRHPQDSDK
ncbi:unnamed protein product [Caenorhabditis angaria]|uniref:Uncharacterized protein n=1 Tax=Caenorhabditis angaria TaxID=860376 RepID=A0A9P1N289_9PELO|nr:unnamed protein product [Caenorhabditis angaria]